MKKQLTAVLAALILASSLSSCSQINDMINSNTTPIETKGSPDTVNNIIGNNDTQSNDSKTESNIGEDSKNNPIPPSVENYKAKMDINSYMQYFVNYFHEQYKIPEKIANNDILSLVLYFCYSNSDVFDFVEINENTQTMYVDGENFRDIAKLLLGDSFDPMDYHDHFNSDETTDKYSVNNDKYITPISKGYWGGDMYYLEFGSKLEITESDDEVSVIANICNDDISRKMKFTFKKIIDDEFLYYQIVEVTLIK